MDPPGFLGGYCGGGRRSQHGERPQMRKIHPNPRPTDSFPCDYTEGVMAGFTFYEDIEASTVAAHGCTCVL